MPKVRVTLTAAETYQTVVDVTDAEYERMCLLEEETNETQPDLIVTSLDDFELDREFDYYGGHIESVEVERLNGGDDDE